MPSPFPGMDPYLEEPGLWPDVHHELISGTRALLNTLLEAQVLRPHRATGLYLRRGRFRPTVMVPDLRITYPDREGQAFFPEAALRWTSPSRSKRSP